LSRNLYKNFFIKKKPPVLVDKLLEEFIVKKKVAHVLGNIVCVIKWSEL
jgi:hypothetical protein